MTKQTFKKGADSSSVDRSDIHHFFSQLYQKLRVTLLVLPFILMIIVLALIIDNPFTKESKKSILKTDIIFFDRKLDYDVHLNGLTFDKFLRGHDMSSPDVNLLSSVHQSVESNKSLGDTIRMRGKYFLNWFYKTDDGELIMNEMDLRDCGCGDTDQMKMALPLSQERNDLGSSRVSSSDLQALDESQIGTMDVAGDGQDDISETESLSVHDDISMAEAEDEDKTLVPEEFKGQQRIPDDDDTISNPPWYEVQKNVDIDSEPSHDLIIESDDYFTRMSVDDDNEDKEALSYIAGDQGVDNLDAYHSYIRSKGWKHISTLSDCDVIFDSYGIN